MGKAKQKSVVSAADVLRLSGAARLALERDGVVKISALGPKGVRDLVLAQLSSEGFEATHTVVRKPISAQLEAALAEGAFIPLKNVALYAQGSTAADAKRVALALVSEGAAALVIRGTEEVLVPASSSVLSRRDLIGFEAVAKAVAKAARSKSGASLLTADLSEALANALPDSFSAFGHPAARTSAQPAKAGLSGVLLKVLSAVDAARDVNTGLSFVPEIVARLGPDLSTDAARGALESAANSGLLELRPEGGINRLSAEELLLCPQGPQGTRLSWARRTENVA